MAEEHSQDHLESVYSKKRELSSTSGKSAIVGSNSMRHYNNQQIHNQANHHQLHSRSENHSIEGDNNDGGRIGETILGNCCTTTTTTTTNTMNKSNGTHKLNGGAPCATNNMNHHNHSYNHVHNNSKKSVSVGHVDLVDDAEHQHGGSAGTSSTRRNPRDGCQTRTGICDVIEAQLEHLGKG